MMQRYSNYAKPIFAKLKECHIGKISLSTLNFGGRSGQGGQEWTRKARMLGGAGHSALEGGEVGGDAVDMEVN